ncbi:MAG: hypothetical protein FWF08_06905 [Oscillospiraceae bacterium]|nr:hypothetical protein [Oscillospiraceae bacterium]
MDKEKNDMPIRAAPYQHQREAYRFTCGLFGMDGEMQSRGAALLMEMGTGKTITGIAITGALYLSGNIRRVTVYDDGRLVVKFRDGSEVSIDADIWKAA